MSDEDAAIGRRLADRYRISELVARGGMARVYRARDERLDRDVAVKILSSPYADDAAFTDQFLAEARAAASISHPSLVHVYDSGSDGDTHYIVMELLDRHRSLREAIDADGPLPAAEVLRIGRELLAGLRVVHDRGLVHCDVKSGNVMLGPGPAKLIDFGIARPPSDAVDGDTSIGSLQFMSPEQLHGEALGPGSDLFSLGVVLYEALTARMPYPGSTPEEVSAAHAAGSVTPPSRIRDGVPKRLDDAILQALRRAPASRFHSAEAMSRALESAKAEVAATVAPGDRDETRVIDVAGRRPDRASAGSGYVPPAVSGPPPQVREAVPVARPAAARRGGSRPAAPPGRSRGLGNLLGTLFILAAAAVVAVLVFRLVFAGTGEPGASETPSAAPSGGTDAPSTVTVPETVGRSTQDGIAAAQEAGLNWTVRCAEDPNQPEGIIGQEPPAGTEVARGSRFTMFSARISDCQ
ncbi:MAG: protein kinase [Chloroflexi bacterium]|nr:protein kinase [Chloroflexota bacterium]